jgi:hypothetical protein
MQSTIFFARMAMPVRGSVVFRNWIDAKAQDSPDNSRLQRAFRHQPRLPFSCPLGATKASKRPRTPEQSEGRKTPNSRCDDARSGSVQHAAAKGGYRRLVRLLTGGLLVRIQPEEPIFSTSYSYKMTASAS